MWLTIFVGLLTGVVLGIISWFRKNFSYWSKYDVPSGKSSIFSGNFWDFLTMKTNFGYHMKTIYDDPKFANDAAVGIYGAYKPGLLIRDPELVKTIFIKDFEKFCDRSGECDPVHDPISRMTMFFAPYSYWRGIRVKMSPVFSSGKLKYMYPLLQAVAANLEKHLHLRGDKFVQELKYMAELFTTDTISTTMMGFQSNALLDPKEPIYVESQKLGRFNLKRALSFFNALFLPQLGRLLKTKIFYDSTFEFLRVSISKVLADREKIGLYRNDLIDVFVKIKKEAAEAGEDETLTMNGLLAQSAILMAGGVETSSSTIAFALFEMAKQPDLLDRLRAEVLQYMLEGNGQISYESLNSMEYVRMVVDETLRKYPVLPVLDRKYVAPSKNTSYSLNPFYNYELPDGMPVYISVYALHSDPKYWPNPKEFDPERFSPENRNTIHPMVYLPFGNGPHNCVGYRLGLLQVKLGLIHILKNHCVKVCDKTILEPEFEPKAFILQTKGGVTLEIVRDNMYDKAANKM